MTPERWQEVRGLLGQALEMDPAERGSFLERATAHDPSLREEVEKMLALQPSAGTDFLLSLATPSESPGALPPSEDPRLGTRFGSYKIIEKIGEGGMGTVYRGMRVDEQYEKDVAIKLVQAGQDSASVVSRFKNERQILASLDHSNIARLLDGGTTEEGVPYFVMELIEGKRFDVYCDEGRLTLEARLKLFLEICSAVQYAHRRLIVHRDIKPGNILVTINGVPKLLDFGIAKLLDTNAATGVDQTAMSMRILTPAYASPEQLQDEPITTASDVYSLGVVLYELLTGHYPYDVDTRSRDALWQAVREQEPRKPSMVVRSTPSPKDGTAAVVPNAVSRSRNSTPQKLSRQLRGDLDRIVLMALRKEPERRYGSVEQFADDITRYLRSLPVMARGDAWTYRAKKFAERHRSAVIATAMVMLALVAGFIVTLREAHIARTERAKAERRFNDVRQLANALIFDIHDSVKKLPGSTGSRKLIVEKALQYLDNLAKESGSDVALQRELASAYQRIGDVQGGANETNLGDTAGSLESYRKALAIRRAVHEANPSQLSSTIELAQSYRGVAVTLKMVGQMSEGLEYIQRARQLTEQAASVHPNEVTILRELASDYEFEAEFLGGAMNASSLGDRPRARIARQKELEVSERMAQLRPDDPVIQRFNAVTVAQMGDYLVEDGQWRESLSYYLRAQEVFERLAAVSKDDRTTMDYLQGMYQRLYFLRMQEGDAHQAALMARKAVEIAKKWSAADPGDVYGKASLGEDYANLASSLAKMPDKKESVSALESALSLTKEVAAKDAANNELQEVRAASLTTAAQVWQDARDYPKALMYQLQAAALRERLQAADPTDVAVQYRLSATYNQVGSILLLKGETQPAGEQYRKALTLALQEKKDPPSEQALYARADAYTGIGDVELRLAEGGTGPERRSHLQQSCKSYEESLKIWQSIREPGAMSPEGFDCIPASVVTQRLAKCRSAVAKAASGTN